MKKISILLGILLIPLCAFAKHEQPERYYQQLWCSENKGTEEVVLEDYTRVDCLTEKYAVEFDFAKKWAECFGQATHYADLTNKKPACVLILETPADMRYYNNVNSTFKKHNVDLLFMTAPSYNQNIKK